MAGATSRRAARRSFAVIFALLLVAFSSAGAYALELYTTSPWLTMITEFVGGNQARVRPLAIWNDAGRSVPLRRPGSGTLVMALDPKEATEFGMRSGRGNLRFMYGSLPVKPIARDSLYFDPSALPFLGQRLLTVLSSADAANYPYYQRRLAEFQSRLESTLEVGRRLLPRVKAVDLTGTVGPWVRAAMPLAVRPPVERFEEWGRGENLDALAKIISDASANKWPIILDAWTIPEVRGRILGVQKNVLIAPPRSDQDFFMYLHDIYLAIWSAVRTR